MHTKWEEIELTAGEAISWIETLEEDNPHVNLCDYERKALSLAKKALADIDTLKRILN